MPTSRLVDRLLASPRYGERWGKYWLEASGYSDSNGYFSADSDRPLAYRYRDYVIRAFNADRPLDQIVREQLAGDELAGERRDHYASSAVIDQLVATHFLRNGQDGTGESDGNPDEVRADKYAVLEGAIQIIGSSLLGLTLQCAKCHDHKFEPVTQKDYYQLQADSLSGVQRRALGQAERSRGDRGASSRAGAVGSARQVDRRPDRFAQAVVRRRAERGQENESAQAGDRGGRTRVASPIRAALHGSAMCRAVQPRSRCSCAATWRTPGPKVGPGVPAFLTDADNRYEAKAAVSGLIVDRSTAGAWRGGLPGPARGRRRFWLECWPTESGNIISEPGWPPRPTISVTPASPPTHPELLEFLAEELVRSGWSAKALHRLILCFLGLSAVEFSKSTGCQSSIPTTACSRGFRSGDSMPRRSATPCSLPPESWMAGRAGRTCRPIAPTSGDVVVAEKAAGATRRSVYLQQRRTQTDSLLEVFDAPSIVTTCTRRSPSTIPLQSLSLLNSSFVIGPGAEARRAARQRLSLRHGRAMPMAIPASRGPSCLRINRTPDSG